MAPALVGAALAANILCVDEGRDDDAYFDVPNRILDFAGEAVPTSCPG